MKVAGHQFAVLRLGSVLSEWQRGTIEGIKDPKVKPDFAQYGFAYQESLIMACIGGSQAHGANWARQTRQTGTEVYIPPPTKVLGLEREEHFVFTTGGKVGGNGPLDVDVCLYTLMKWAGLAAKGNPSALHFLFAPLEFTTQTWDQFSARRELFLAKGHSEAIPRIRGRPDETIARAEGAEEHSPG